MANAPRKPAKRKVVPAQLYSNPEARIQVFETSTYGFFPDFPWISILLHPIITSAPWPLLVKQAGRMVTCAVLL
jgi:hypothetical protein